MDILRARRFLGAAGSLLLAAGVAPAAAQGGQMVRVGLYYGSSALAAVTLAPGGPSAAVAFTEGGTLETVPGTTYLRDYAFRVLDATTTDLATGQADVRGLGQKGYPAYLEATPAGTYDVFAGPYALASSAQAAAAALSASQVEGPYGVLVPEPGGLAAAQAAAPAYWQEGLTAYPVLQVTGQWGLLVGSATSAAAAQAQYGSLETSTPGASYYTPTGEELEAQTNSGAASFLLGSAAALTITGDQGVISIDSAAYRGTLTLYLVGGTRLAVVNTLPLEQYLYAVVPSEMPADWPQAALQTQAVASRSYALFQIQHAPSGSLFDVAGSTVSQAYGGYAAENPNAKAAVDATAGQVLTYQGQVIDAVFSADSGGATEDAQNVWGNYVPYLRGVDELPGYRPGTWTVTYTAQQIQHLVLAWSGVDLGQVQSVQPAGMQQTFSGRPLSVTFTGTGGSYTAWRDSIRGALRLESTLFTLSSDAQVNVAGAGSTATLPSLAAATVTGADGTGPLPASVTVAGATTLATYPLYPSVYTLNGRGNGHGVGMGQDGALYMAQQGYTYTQILTHYYTAVSLTSAY